MKPSFHRPFGFFPTGKTKAGVLCGLAVTCFIFSFFIAQGSENNASENRDEMPLPQSMNLTAHPANAVAGDSTLQSLTTSQVNRPQRTVQYVPVYNSFDFLTGYLDNRTTAIIVNAIPWINNSTNVTQYQQENGGTTFWDYWPSIEDWESPNHMWQDEQGTWRRYKKEVIHPTPKTDRTAYVLVDRPGPGVLNELWFTNDATSSFLRLLNFNIGSIDSEELTQWGNLFNLGNLRIEVDDRIVFDGPIKKWFSGEAQHLTPELAQVFVWRYRQFGSDGNIIPIPYQEHIKVSVYGGSEKPKWFMVTGVMFPQGTMVKPYTGKDVDLPIDKMARYAKQVLQPETYLDTLDYRNAFTLTVQPGVPAVVAFNGSGTVQAIQIKIQKKYDPKNLRLRIKYGNDVGVDIPLIAFFGEPDQISLHHSSPLGIVETGDAYLFYSNYPMPFQKEIAIEISTESGAAIPLTLRAGITNETTNTQFRVFFKPSQRLEMFGPNYQADVEGDGKLVGLVLVTKDQELNKIQKVYIKDGRGMTVEDPGTQAWSMGYLEGNLHMYDGMGNTRLYSGQEDWAGGGYYFNSGFTAPPGGSNRPFGGLLRYDDGEESYATLFRYFNDLAAFRFKNGLHLMFGHGTWRNNFAVKYGATLYYYREIEGIKAAILPASEHATVTELSLESTP